ncbi:MAG: hypothetical protein IPK17_18705 [Chloroflexi bacterium]|nr:hypothetical protein [Chloroflexota bacterium]
MIGEMMARLERLKTRIERFPVGGGVGEVQPHIVGVFVVAVIVVDLRPDRFKAVLFVQVLRDDVAHAHFEHDIGGAERKRPPDHRGEQNFAPAVATKLRMCGDGAHVGFVDDVPQTAIADNHRIALGQDAKVADDAPPVRRRFLARRLFQHDHVAVVRFGDLVLIGARRPRGIEGHTVNRGDFRDIWEAHVAQRQTHAGISLVFT